MKLRSLTALVILLAAGAAVAQRYREDRGWRWIEDPRTAREVPSDSTGTPVWEYPPALQHDVFTFARIRYESRSYGWGGGRRGRRGGGWRTDLPDSDLNLSWRLQQMTSMCVDPNGRIIRPTDPELADFPFIYIVEPGALEFSDEEVLALQKYLLNGGFLWFDDFWGEDAWDNVAAEMKRVLPALAFIEIPLDHPIYKKCIFDIKDKGQVPNMRLGHYSQNDGVTWEEEDAREVHHRGIFDDQGRLIVLATHNTDNGDGWEREGYSEYYFKQFSERTAYPLAINVIFYVMTH